MSRHMSMYLILDVPNTHKVPNTHEVPNTHKAPNTGTQAIV